MTSASNTRVGNSWYQTVIRRPDFGAGAATALLFVFFAIVGGSKGFLSTAATAGWLNLSAQLGIVAVAVGVLLIAGEYDLSVGSVVGASAVIVAVGRNVYDLNPVLCVVLALLVGVVVGLLNGTVVLATGMPSFIVTLATNFILYGLAVGISRTVGGSSTVSVPESGHTAQVFAAHGGLFSIAIVWWLALALIGSFLLMATKYGNWVFATGGSSSIASRAGAPVRQVKLVLFTLTASCAALLGVIQAFTFNVGDAATGQSYVFQGLVASVIGGVLLTGGYGSVIGVCFGAAVYGIVQTGVFYTGWSSDYATAVIGLLLVLAVLANNYVRKLALASPKRKSS